MNMNENDIVSIIFPSPPVAGITGGCPFSLQEGFRTITREIIRHIKHSHTATATFMKQIQSAEHKGARESQFKSETQSKTRLNWWHSSAYAGRRGCNPSERPEDPFHRRSSVIYARTWRRGNYEKKDIEKRVVTRGVECDCCGLEITRRRRGGDVVDE